MKTNSKKVVRVEESTHGTSNVQWIEFPAYRH
jgi:hypothetical protein